MVDFRSLFVLYYRSHGSIRKNSIITYFSNHKPIGRRGKNGAEDFKNLDRVLQDLGFAGKPHPDIFIQNEPETVFEGLETFQKAKGLKVDGAVKNKDSETGIALNKAMAEFYNPEERGPQPAANQEAQVPKPGLPTKPKLPAQPEYPGADRPAAPAGPYLPDGSQKPVLPPKPQIKPISGGGHQQFIGGKWVAVPILGSHDAAESLPLGSMYQIGGDVFRRR